MQTGVDGVADPFLLRREGRWYLFFEAIDSSSGLGFVALLSNEGGDLQDWVYRGEVLREGFHLSYPCVFAWQHRFYMVPESAAAHEVRLYIADDFPHAWRFHKRLIRGAHLDPSLFQHDGRWWMFSMTEPECGGTLRLFHADTPEGQWEEHPRSPLITRNPHITRPGGRVLCRDGRLFRITQDTSPDYGRQLFAFEITRLTPETYEERAYGNGPILRSGSGGAFADKVHHLDCKKLENGLWISVIDRGRCFLKPRIRPRSPSTANLPKHKGREH